MIIETCIDDKDKEHYQRFYLSLGPLWVGFFAGSRPVICLDGCHLRGPHPCILLTAIGIDLNNSMYPLKWAMVEAKNK